MMQAGATTRPLPPAKGPPMHRRTFLASAACLPLAAPLHAEQVLRIRDLYTKMETPSELALAADGQRVTFTGFMAPPLKAESRFFVLTERPMAVCPFCETEAEWPSDIIAVYARRVVKVTPFNRRIEVRGLLELGSFTDPETGFVSLVRLEEASFA